MTAANFHILRQRLRLTGEITALTALRIGSGGAGELDGADLPVLRDREGFPFIPGGSLKGVLRSTVESLLRGALDDPHHQLWPCDPHRETRRSDGDRDGACGWHPSNQRSAAEAAIDAHCPVCQLFGSRVLASHVRFTDAHICDDQRHGRPPIEVRDGVAIDRDLRIVHRKGLKYDFEVISPGTRFFVELFVDNPDDALMGLLVMAFDQLADGFSALGGFSSRGLGRVQWSWVEQYRVTARDLLEAKPGVKETALSPIFDAYRRALAERVEV